MTLINVLKNQADPIKLIAPDLSFDFYKKINLSEEYFNINSIESNSSKKLAIYINDFLDLHNKKIAYGGYLEKRSLYKRSSHFGLANKKNERNIHLGIDLWSSAGTLVLAPFNGTIHSFRNNINLGDYGPTIILKHMLKGIKFYTLYGHLSKNDLNKFKVGDKILASSVIGSLGSMKENGDYPPHLHFQIILDIENFYGDYPGVCSENDLKYYSQNCPDPNLVLKLSSF
tara:strand:+ start:1326 stop:2012 length:687 start_codon:yes stop_codon:yes gene_type:complete